MPTRLLRCCVRTRRRGLYPPWVDPRPTEPPLGHHPPRQRTSRNSPDCHSRLGASESTRRSLPRGMAESAQNHPRRPRRRRARSRSKTQTPPVDRRAAVVQARAGLRAAGRSSTRCQTGKIMRAVPVHALSQLLAERVGAAAQVRRRRVPRGRKGDVRQRGQSLGRRQFHDRLAGAGHVVAGQLLQVRPERPAALADHDRLLPAADSPEARSVRRSTPTTTSGSRATAASRSRSSTRTASRWRGPDGITFDGKLGLMQGVIVTPGGDVGSSASRRASSILFPKGDPARGRIVCEGRTVEPCKSFRGAIPPRHRPEGSHLGDEWLGAHVTRLPASDPNQARS